MFDTRGEADTYAAAHPVLRRNASGSLLRHAAPVNVLTNGKFAVVA